MHEKISDMLCLPFFPFCTQVLQQRDLLNGLLTDISVLGNNIHFLQISFIMQMSAFA